LTPFVRSGQLEANLVFDGVSSFAGDLPEEEQKLIWATHAAPVADLFTQKVEGTAWRSKPSWYIVATKDRTIQPELERFVASAWVQQSSRPIAATYRCCPSLTSCWT